MFDEAPAIRPRPMRVIEAAAIGRGIAPTMRETDFELRVGVEHAAKDQMRHGNRCVERIADDIDEIVIGEALGMREARRMHENEDVELLRLGKKRAKALIGEVRS